MFHVTNRGLFNFNSKSASFGWMSWSETIVPFVVRECRGDGFDRHERAVKSVEGVIAVIRNADVRFQLLGGTDRGARREKGHWKGVLLGRDVWLDRANALRFMYRAYRVNEAVMVRRRG